MTGPDGDKPHGWWQVLAVEPPHRLELEDGFADDDGTPNDAMPTTTMVVTLTERDGGGTVMTIETQLPVARGDGAARVDGHGGGDGRGDGPDRGILAEDVTTP